MKPFLLLHCLVVGTLAFGQTQSNHHRKNLHHRRSVRALAIKSSAAASHDTSNVSRVSPFADNGTAPTSPSEKNAANQTGSLSFNSSLGSSKFL